jgi:hypothetical protein
LIELNKLIEAIEFIELNKDKGERSKDKGEREKTKGIGQKAPG